MDPIILKRVCKWATLFLFVCCHHQRIELKVIDHLKEVDKVANILAATKMLWYEVLHSPLVAKNWNRSDLLTKKKREKITMLEAKYKKWTFC